MTPEASVANAVGEADAEVSAHHPAENGAVEHLWTHSNDADWPELTEGGGLRVFESASGSTLTDVRGRKYLDGLSGLFVVNVGHGRAEIGEAMAKQASEIAYSAASNYANTASVSLAETVARLTPGDLNRIFLCSGGSEAVESAVKIAKQAQFLRGFPKRYKVIARRGSYHGMTYGAMSLTSSAKEQYFGPMMAGVSKIPSPNRYKNDFGLDGEEGDLMCARFLDQEIRAQDPETVAAFIAEPISVANGTHVPAAGYWQEIRSICDRHGVLLIMDEVVTGFGRSGKTFAAEHFGVTADLTTMAKGLSSGYAPVGAVAVTPAVFEPFKQPGTPLGHLLTFGGNAVAAAGASANLEIIDREGLVEQAAEKGSRLYQLASSLSDHPTVGDVRGGTGLMLGVELVKSKESKENWGSGHAFTKALAQRIYDRGVLTRVWDVLHLAPPFVITDDELQRLVEAVDESLTETEAEFADQIQ